MVSNFPPTNPVGMPMVLEGSARAVKAGLVPVFVIQSRKKQGKKKRSIVLQILQIFYIHDQLHMYINQ